MATRKPIIGPRRPAYFRKTGKGAPWEILVLNHAKLAAGEGNPYEQHVGTSRDECNAWAETRRAELAEGIVNRKAGRTLGELLDAWLDSIHDTPGRAPRTFLAYRASCARVPTALRKRLAHEIAPSELLRFRNQLVRDGLGLATVRHTFTCLAMAWDHGMRDDIATGGPLSVRPNPARPPALPKLMVPTSTTPKACPRIDREAIRAELPGAMRVMVDLCYGAGLRFAEALAITPSCVDRDALTLTVGGQWSRYGKGSTGTTSLRGIATAKSRRSQGRVVPVPAWLVTALAEHERLYGLSGVGTYSMGARNTAHPLDSRTWAENLSAARERAGVATAWTAHSWRHAFASEHLANGAPVADVARWMGDSVLTVIRTYTHAIDTSARPAVELPAPARRESVGKRHLKSI